MPSYWEFFVIHFFALISRKLFNATKVVDIEVSQAKELTPALNNLIISTLQFQYWRLLKLEHH